MTRRTVGPAVIGADRGTHPTTSIKEHRMTDPPHDDRLRHLIAQEINPHVASWKLAFFIADGIVTSREVRGELKRIAEAHAAAEHCGDRNCEHCWTASVTAAAPAAAPSAPADRPVILREAADALVAVAGQHPEARAVVIHWGDAAALLRTMAQEECDELEAQAHLDELADDLSRMAVEAQQPETQAAADCPYGEGPGDGSGCIKPAGHDGDHVVTPGVTVVPCSRAVLQQPHIPHSWWPQPGMAYVQCPGHSVGPAAVSRTVEARQADTAGEQE